MSRMKSKTINIAVLLAALFSLVSCLDTNDGDYVYTDDSAVTAFSVTSAKKAVHVKASNGADSVYYTTATLTAYKFVIDQQRCVIYNPDSLPYGVDPTKLLVSANSVNSGSLVLKSMTSDSLSYLSTTDSLDFSKPRELQVYSLSGAAVRKYEVRVNVHQEPADQFNWTKLPNPTAFTNATGVKSFVVTTASGTTRRFLLASDGTTTTVYRADGDNAWTAATPNFNHTLAAETYRSAAVKHDTLFVCDNGVVMATTDGDTWAQQTTAEAGVARIIAANPIRLYAYNNEGAMVSSDDSGKTWKAAGMDESASLLPNGDIAYATLPLATNPNAYRTLLIGLVPAASTTAFSVWGKIDEGTAYSENQPWMFYDHNSLNRHELPIMNNVSALAYDGKMMVVGNDERVYLPAFYASRDGGITWEADTVITSPLGFFVTGPYTVSVDKDHFIWFVSGKTGETWRGRINRLGWKKEQYEYYE